MTARLLAWLIHWGLGPLALTGLGIAVIIGLVGPGRLGQLLLRAGLILVLGPFVVAFSVDVAKAGLQVMPLWVVPLVVLLLLALVFRVLLSLLLGKGAADQAVGTMAVDAIYAGSRMAGRLLRLLAKLIGWPFLLLIRRRRRTYPPLAGRSEPGA